MRHHITKAAAVLAIAAAAGVSASTARAGTAFVNPFNCAVLDGGAATVPAGSTVTIRQGIAENARGAVQSYLNAQTTTLSVNGGPIPDLSDDWTGPLEMSDGSWQARVTYDTGVTLGAGQSLTFSFEIVLAHPVPEVGGTAGTQINPRGSQGVWSCTVTAV
jgi:hypothetical protein